MVFQSPLDTLSTFLPPPPPPPPLPLFFLKRSRELFDVATNVQVTESTDVWSLGCILYAMMYLESPFDQDYISGGSLLLSMMSGKIRFPSQDKTKVYPESMHELVKKILVLDRNVRPSVEQVLEMVEEELRVHKPR